MTSGQMWALAQIARGGACARARARACACGRAHGRHSVADYPSTLILLLVHSPFALPPPIPPSATRHPPCRPHSRERAPPEVERPQLW